MEGKKTKKNETKNDKYVLGVAFRTWSQRRNTRCSRDFFDIKTFDETKKFACPLVNICKKFKKEKNEPKIKKLREWFYKWGGGISLG